MTTQAPIDPVYEGVEAQLPQLSRYARALTRNVTTAEDLVQECVARALDKSHLYRRGTNLRAWLFTILHNLYMSDMRKHARAGHTVDVDDMQRLPSIAANQEDWLALKTVGRAMRELPDMQRRAIELIGIKGLSYEQASEELRLPVGTLKSRVSRARSSLRDKLAGATHARKNGAADAGAERHCSLLPHPAGQPEAYQPDWAAR